MISKSEEELAYAAWSVKFLTANTQNFFSLKLLLIFLRAKSSYLGNIL